MGSIKSYRDLIIWQRAVDFCVLIYQQTGEFPASESFGLSAQMKRAAVSIASNIAEGHRGSNKEFARYLQISLGSLAELETQIEIASRVGLLPSEYSQGLASDLSTLGKQISTLLKRVHQDIEK